MVLAVYIALIFIMTMLGVLLSDKMPQWLFREWQKECTDYLKAPIVYKATSRLKVVIISSLFILSGIAVTLRFHPNPAQTIAALAFTWALLVSSIIDADYKILPDQLSLTLLWLGLLVNSFSMFSSLSLAVFGASAGYMLLFFVFNLYKLLTKKEGLGHGDFKLLAAIGAWLGLGAVPIVLLIASVSACIVIGSKLLLSKTSMQEQFAFGPFLAFAGWLLLIGKPFLM
jgi:leader peptidase (prepilin peptidase)/N-methyltransferase